MAAMRPSRLPQIAFVINLLAGSGCSEALKGPTSGQIGCAEQDITISENTRGLASRTWTATCQGKTYYCSAHSSGEKGAQVSCTRANHETDAPQQVTVVDGNGAPVRSHSSAKPFPTEVLGFRFGMTRAEAEATCLAGEHEWAPQGTTFRCKDAPNRIGASTSTFLGFCGGEACLIAMTATFDGDDPNADKAFLRIANALQVRYGVPRVLESNIPRSCQKTIVGCAARKQASWRARWAWSGRRNILAQLQDQNDQVRLLVRYSAVPQGVALDGADEVEAQQGIDTSAF